MRPMIDPLESRTLLAVTVTPPTDPGGSPSSEFDLGSLRGVKVVKETISSSDTDVYRLRVGKGNFNLALSKLEADAKVELLNNKGKVLASSDKDGNKTERISRALNKGTYHVRVTGDGATPYTLRLQADNNFGSLRHDGERRDVGLYFPDGSTRGISARKETWIVIHGWQSDPNGLAISNLTDALDDRTRADQVLVLDWSEPASDSSIIGAADWVPVVSNWVRQRLAQWGLTTAKINVAGHSLGGYMAGRIAGDVSGGVNRVVALDPATLSLGDVDFTGIDYADDSRFSLAFIGSTYSSPPAAYTADETIEMNVGAKSSIITHSNVVDLFAEMVREGDTDSPDPISRLFAVERLNPQSRPDYKEDAFDGEYEGVLTGKFESGRWRPDSFTYRNAGTNQNVTVDA